MKSRDPEEAELTSVWQEKEKQFCSGSVFVLQFCRSGHIVLYSYRVYKLRITMLREKPSGKIRVNENESLFFIPLKQKWAT